MNGFDALISREVKDAELYRAVAEVMKLKIGQLIILHDYPLEDLGDDVLAICMKTGVEGDFPLKISIDVLVNDRPCDAIEVSKSLAAELAADMLLDDGTANPYRMLRVQPSGNANFVGLNVEDADKCIYRLEETSSVHRLAE